MFVSAPSAIPKRYRERTCHIITTILTLLDLEANGSHPPTPHSSLLPGVCSAPWPGLTAAGKKGSSVPGVLSSGGLTSTVELELLEPSQDWYQPSWFKEVTGPGDTELERLEVKSSALL